MHNIKEPQLGHSEMKKDREDNIYISLFIYLKDVKCLIDITIISCDPLFSLEFAISQV